MGRRYLDLARLGRNSPGRYLAALGLIFFFWFGLGFAVMALMLSARGAVRALGGPAAGRFLEYVALNLSFVTFLIGILLAVKWIHQRSPRTLITPASRVDWRRVAQGFVVWLVLAALASLVEALLFPGRYELSLNLPLFLAMAPVVLLLTPLQTSSEELFFRGYLLQAFGLRTRNPLALALITAALFTLPPWAIPRSRRPADRSSWRATSGSACCWRSSPLPTTAWSSLSAPTPRTTSTRPSSRTTPCRRCPPSRSSW